MAGSPEHVRSASEKTNQLLDKLALEVRGNIENPSPDQVHDLRVAARRLGQMVAVLDSASQGQGIGKIRRKLKNTITLAGAVRDCDIAAKLTGKLHAPARFQSRLRRRRAEAERELLSLA